MCDQKKRLEEVQQEIKRYIIDTPDNYKQLGSILTREISNGGSDDYVRALHSIAGDYEDLLSIKSGKRHRDKFGEFCKDFDWEVTSEIIRLSV